MAIGPREVMRSEVDGGLSGPANPIPNESLDCGCKQFPCPKLAKFATRRLFVGLLCWVGVVQAAAQAYLYITSPTIARRFQFDPQLIDWILTIAELTPAVLALLVAYWGDRIHRAAWTGALVLLQSAGFIILLIPHFTHTTRVIEEPENVTHMSIYADDNPELCSSGLARLVIEEDEPCYTTLGILIVVQILTGMANIAYYSLGISYLDDNTKKRHVAALLGVVIAVKVIGLLLGYILAWGCLRLDSKNLNIVESYREQVGAWWLGWPILAFFLAVPALLISWLPRRLPSEVVEQAAASILDLAGRSSPGSTEVIETKVGGIGYFTSLLRLFTNKILICNVLAAVFCTTAVINFVASENIFLESRYHVPRPTGMLLGFGDPFSSRLIVSILKPIIIAMLIIISGMVISRARPHAKTLTIYNVIALVLAATIIFALVFATCEKPLIAGENKNSITLLKYCNKNCRCSKDADFRPICDSKSTFTFYSPCHAGCKTVEYVDDVKIYGGCSCVEETTGMGNEQAKDGPCGSTTCQLGWMVFEVGTLLAYSLVASCLVSSVLILLRSVYLQDKALAIGFWMTIVSCFVYALGKSMYQAIANGTCKHWGKGAICHLHDTDSLGDYLCYVTAIFLVLGAGFEIILCFFCQKLRLYEVPESELPRSTELQEVDKTQAVPLLEETAGPSDRGRDETDVEVSVVVIESPVLDLREKKVTEDAHQESTGQLKYGPLGPGDRRTTSAPKGSQEIEAINPRMRHAETDDELESSSDEDAAPGKKNERTLLGSSPYVAYKPLELDSDVESDLSSIGPRSRRRVPSGIFDDLRPFPNPDHYEDPGSSRKPSSMGRLDAKRGKSLEDLEAKGQGGFSRTNSFEFSKKDKNDSFKSHDGDFNEVGIPVMEPLVASVLANSGNRQSGQELPQQVLLPRHQKRVSQERLDTIRSLLDSVDENRRHRLENETLPEEEPGDYPDVPPPIVGRPPSRGQSSSGFGSLPDVGEKHEHGQSSSLPGSQAKNATTKIPETSISSRTTSPLNTRPKRGPLSTAL